ncbi:preprotein translocase subunit SecE [Candidatus Saccharibacteria bacterium]|nr:preprotein translocase subunit SecE [Candidatus Saccharibacteria bacterium]
MAKKPRLRKAPTTQEQAETITSNTASSGLSRGLSAKKRLLWRLLRPFARPIGWLMPTYFINSWREVKQVSWPNRRETWRLTLAVFVFAIVFGALIAGVDWVLDQGFKKVILKQ